MFAVNNNPYIVTTDMYAVGIQINMRRYSRTDARRAADPPGDFPGFPIVGCLSSGSTSAVRDRRNRCLCYESDSLLEEAVK